MNPLQLLNSQGQSVWLDYVRRDMLTNGGLARHVSDDAVTGVTSNPSIFEKAIGGSPEYDAAIADLVGGGEADALAIFEALAVEDIRHGADILRPVYDRTGGADGFISLEVSPYLALETEPTLVEARHLWQAVGRPNLMVKVPGTEAGAPAIRQLISEGININVTLLFSLDAYKAVAEAYLAGLEALDAAGGDLSRVASVASFFVSRIDTVIDKAIDGRIAAGDPEKDALAALKGKVAIANAKVAYAWYQELCASDRWQRLATKGAKPQRLLWASTGTKNPAYRDVLYVEELIGPETVNTMPLATLEAFRDHGLVRQSLTENVEEARHQLAEVERLGLDLDRVTIDLVTDGVQLFADAADQLFGAVETKRQTLLGRRLNSFEAAIGDAGEPVKAELETWRRAGNIRRLWQRDASLWTGADEARWLDWLDVVARQRREAAGPLKDFAAEVKARNFTDILLLGMGGSSLGPEVLAATFGVQSGFPRLHVLDSTDPAQVKSFEAKIDPARTLFIVSSKSGSTLEPNILKQYFFDVAEKALGSGKAGAHFVTVTDPGSKMEQVAQADGFWRIFHGQPQIGGRYSILSHFGTVPAAAMGMDVEAFLASTDLMVGACGPGVPPAVNPGVSLGCVLGVLARQGRDKISIVASPGIGDFGAWLEQLIAESTGKVGKGIIPVDGEPLAGPDLYGEDRLFAYLRLDAEADAAQDAAIDALAAAGQPVVRIGLPDRKTLGQEFFRWEIATAVAGAVIGINPFDQPDVEASKIKTRALTDAYEQSGELPAETPFHREDGILLYADADNITALGGAAIERTLDAIVRAHLERLKPSDYCALLAYIERDPAHIAALTAMRTRIRDRTRRATCVGFGPRFLHSTGQAYKGGPNTGVFLQITSEKAADVPVPGQRYSFATVEAAQARGDFDVLAERGRRALRIHLGSDVAGGLARLAAAIEKALG